MWGLFPQEGEDASALVIKRPFDRLKKKREKKREKA
jgi:hypothetical protein